MVDPPFTPHTSSSRGSPSSASWQLKRSWQFDAVQPASGFAPVVEPDPEPVLEPAPEVEPELEPEPEPVPVEPAAELAPTPDVEAEIVATEVAPKQPVSKRTEVLISATRSLHLVLFMAPLRRGLRHGGRSYLGICATEVAPASVPAQGENAPLPQLVPERRHFLTWGPVIQCAFSSSHARECT